ncbi:MAG TPA: Flp pilus assembly protein CpaB [Dehalococcoidia bacterium]|jgi:pilus assembly protein CpaB
MARSIAGSAPNRTNRRFLIIAILLAGLSAALVYAKISAGDDAKSTEIAAGTTQVVVAKEPIKQRETITEAKLLIKPVPTNNVIGGHFEKLEDVIGKVSKYPIEANEQVVASGIVDTENPVSDAALSLLIPTGKRAMSIKASQVSNAGGLILPGDYVDVVWMCCQGRAALAKTVVQNVQVAAVAQALVDSGPSQDGTDPVAAKDGEPDPEASTITLLLTQEEAHLLFLAESNGDLRAELRGPGDIDRASDDFTLITKLLPLEIANQLPEELRPDGYKPAGR